MAVSSQSSKQIVVQSPLLLSLALYQFMFCLSFHLIRTESDTTEAT